jgi:hypothetical protein
VSGRTWNIIAAVLRIIAGMISAFAALISRPTTANIVALFGSIVAAGCGAAWLAVAIKSK